MYDSLINQFRKIFQGKGYGSRILNFAESLAGVAQIQIENVSCCLNFSLFNLFKLKLLPVVQICFLIMLKEDSKKLEDILLKNITQHVD